MGVGGSTTGNYFFSLGIEAVFGSEKEELSFLNDDLLQTARNGVLLPLEQHCDIATVG